MKPNAIWTVFFLIFGYASAFIYAAADELPFEVSTVQYKNYPRLYTFDATIEAIRRATVSSETSGRISEINFDVDEYVKRGSVLVRITDATTRARLSGVEAKVSEAEAQYNIALSEFNRIQEVYQQKLVSKSAFDKAEAGLKTATQRLTAAKAKVKEVLEQLKYTVVKAPFSGVVAERHVELGEMAKVGQPLMTGFAANELRAVAQIPQSLVQEIRSSHEATIIANGKKESLLHSSMITVFPQADTATHTYKVRVKLPNVPKGIYPGHMVKLQFAAGTEQKIRVPINAVVLRSELQAVYVVIKDKDTGASRVTLRQIRLGRHNADNTVDILAGLREGESIALDPVSAGVFLKEHPNEHASQ